MRLSFEVTFTRVMLFNADRLIAFSNHYHPTTSVPLL